MGSCSPVLKNNKSTPTLSIDFSDSFGLKGNVIKLVLRLGSLISSTQKKYLSSLEVKNRSLAFDYMIKKLILEEKLNSLKEIIKKLKIISRKSKKNSTIREQNFIRTEIESIESWLKCFKLSSSVKESELEDYIKQFDQVAIYKQIDCSISNLKFAERVCSLKEEDDLSIKN